MRLSRRLPLVTLVGTAVVALASAAVATPVSSGSGSASGRTIGVIRPAPAATVNATTSSNWFGYNISAVARNENFRQVGGTWRVPRATQHKKGQAEYSSSWIGIGGGCVRQNQFGCTSGDNTLIQAGTEQSIAPNGAASYHSWYELIPAPSIQTPLVVGPNHMVRANIRQTVVGIWRISLENLSTGKSWSTTVPYTSTYRTAEWITETPIVIGTDAAGLAALPNLTPVHFDWTSVNGRNPRLRSSERVFLAPGQQIIGAPSLPQPEGNGFAACAWRTTCAVPANF